MGNNYHAEIKETSKELSVKERIAIKDTLNAIKIDEKTKECKENKEKFIINVDYYVTLSIHNEKSENKDYELFVIVDKNNGEKYVTGSSSFINSFTNIAEEMNGDDFSIECYRVASKNYKGKEFISCSII